VVAQAFSEPYGLRKIRLLCPGWHHGFLTPRILVIEDESVITPLVVEMLTDQGYEVRSAALGSVQVWPRRTIMAMWESDFDRQVCLSQPHHPAVARTARSPFGPTKRHPEAYRPSAATVLRMGALVRAPYSDGTAVT
jgi:hypothetical protein